MKESKNGIKVALIDDGIHESMDSVFISVNRCYVEKGILYEGCTGTVKPSSHGTICAGVIASIETDIQLYDIRIFEDGGAEMMDLKAALQYCILCGIQVVNLSCGTLNYMEYRRVEGTIKRLQRRKCLIVSAFSNQGLLSFPARCRGVFGVREDCGGSLTKGEYGFQKYAGGRLENSIVAYADTVIIDKEHMKLVGNSFAAPVITGQIVRILKEHPRCSCKQVLRRLRLHGESERCKGRLPEKYLPCQKKEISTPVLGVNRDCYSFKNFLRERLEKEGYHVAVVSESVRERAEIPARYYLDRKMALNRDIISTIEQIYVPDIIIFYLDRQRFDRDEILEMVDVRISKSHQGIQIEYESDIFCGNDYTKVYENIIHFLS